MITLCGKPFAEGDRVACLVYRFYCATCLKDNPPPFMVVYTEGIADRAFLDRFPGVKCGDSQTDYLYKESA